MDNPVQAPLSAPKSYICRIKYCNKEFSKSSNLYRHEENIHHIKRNKKHILPVTNYQSEPVEVILPTGYEYKNVVEIPDGKTFNINLFSEGDVTEWLQKFSTLTKTIWRVKKTSPSTKYTLYNTLYKCKHNLQKKEHLGRSSKGTGCLASMKIIIEKNPNELQENNYPCKITVNNAHNHHVGIAMSLKCQDVSQEIKDKLAGLFSSGHTVPSALKTIITDAIIEHGNNYFRIDADRSLIPDEQFCYNFFYKIQKGKYGKLGLPEEEDRLLLKNKLENWEKAGGGKFQTEFFEGNTIVCILTSLMERVHENVQQSGELMFVDATGHSDRLNHCIYLLYTHSVAGGLPLGIIITSSSQQHVFERALTLYCKMLNSKSFFNKGVMGPQSIITDKDMAERNALKHTWEHTKLFLCTVHVLRAVWRWLLKKDNDVSREHTRALFFLVKNIMYAKNPDDALKAYDLLTEAPEVKENPRFLQYFNNEWWSEKEAWCIAHRREFLLRGNNTNNYVEYAVRALKDIILERMKAYNIIQLVDFIVERYDRYYMKRLLDCTYERMSMSLLRKFLPDMKDIKPEYIEKLSDDSYSVVNNNNVYNVNTDIGFCSCPVGVNGQLCKHQSAIIIMGLGTKFPPNCYGKDIKNLLFFIATGQSPPSKWLEDIHIVKETLNDSSSMECSVSVSQTPTSSDSPLTLSSSSEDTASTSCIISDPFDKDLNVNCDKSSNQYEDADFTKFCNILDKIKERVCKNKSLPMKKSMKTFMRNYTYLTKTDNALQSSLTMWGRWNGFKKLCSATKIGIQPGFRRKSGNSSRNRQTAGRPPKSAVRDTHKHNYTMLGRLPARKRKAPHNITDNVQSNTASGN